jgi:hypothetical protein
MVPLIPRAVLFGNPDKASARISPNGKQIAYLAPLDGVLNVWVAPASDIQQAKPVTADKKRGIRIFFWAHTNDNILYQQDVGGDEDWHVYSVNLQDGKTIDLTPLKKVAAQIEGVSYKHPDEVLIGLNDRDPQFHDIYRVNIKTGERKLIETNTQFAGYLTDDEYRVRFAMRFTPDGGNQWLKPDGDGGWTDFLQIPMADTLTTSPAGFDKSNENLYLIDSRGRNTGALLLYNPKTGKGELIAANDKADLGAVMAHPTEKNIQAVRFN